MMTKEEGVNSLFAEALMPQPLALRLLVQGMLQPPRLLEQLLLYARIRDILLAV